MKRPVQVAPRETFYARMYLAAVLMFLPGTLLAQNFSCPAGQYDTMAYFAMSAQARNNQFMYGHSNSIYTEVYPNMDFAKSGYWFWLKSPSAHGFDVKAFDSQFVYMRSTERHWKNNTSFKRFVNDLPIAARCVRFGQPGPRIKVPDTTFQYFASCSPYKSKNIGTAVNDLDAPVLMDAGGNIGAVPTRVLHYQYDCDQNFGNCQDEEQFFLGNGYGLWQWKHYKNGKLKKTALMSDLQKGIATQMLPCPESYK